MVLRRATGLLAAAVLAATLLSAPAHAAPRPNVVFVLTDDLSWDLVRAMPHVRALQRRGLTFSRYIVSDSLCCPSRSSIFTGRFPHSTGIFTNSGRDGGYHAFHNRGWERRTFATALRERGYRTAMMGKYLNGYEPAADPLPPGWTTWDVAGNGGYLGFGYDLGEDGAVVHHGTAPEEYLTDVLAAKGEAFIDAAASAGSPFALEIATYAPHVPATPAPRHAGLFRNARVPRRGAFNRPNADAPRWLAARQALTPDKIARLDALYRKRLQSVQAVDELLGRLEDKLAARGVLDDTYVVFSSDNGFHLGEHRLNRGKMTAFDTDIRVPLIVAGPGVPAGRTSTRLVQNTDLHPTFVRLAGGTPSPRVDGRSLVALLHGAKVPAWRTAALIEHHHPATDPSDPDRQAPGAGNPPTYEAIRLPNAVYVEYRTGEHEYYRIDRDPDERVNAYRRLPRRERSRLHARLAALSRCRGAASCRRAGEPRR